MLTFGPHLDYLIVWLLYVVLILHMCLLFMLSPAIVLRKLGVVNSFKPPCIYAI
jgi:hypothetical protein